MKTYDIVLLQKEGATGLVRDEVNHLLSMLSEDDFFPIEIEASIQECSAMGFIGTLAAEKLDYDYETSGFTEFIQNILDDMTNENPDSEYKFKGISIYLGY